MIQDPSSQGDEIKTRKVELVLQQLDSLPTLPMIALRLMALTGSPESKMAEVVALLSADQSLTSKLLSLANSAMIGIKHPITSVQQAVVMLGFETVRNLVLSVKVFEVFQQRGGGDEQTDAPSPFERAEFWKHSLAVATAAEMLAAHCKPRLNVHDAFVCGLLHDIGKVAFDTAMPKSFARVVEVAMMTRGDLADVERRIIGLDHGLAGKRIAEAWNLPQIISQAIWLHGAPPPPANTPNALKASGVSNLGICLLVGLADMLVRRQHIGFSGNYLFPYESRQYTQHLGLSDQEVNEVTSKLTDALETRARAIGLYDMESKQLYLQSIANANAELGRVNQQLGMQNRKLATRSSCFEMMTRFYQRIIPAASPSQLLSEIGHAAHQFLESSKLVLFSQDPDQSPADAGAANAVNGSRGMGIGDVLLFDPSRAVHDSFLMHMPAYGGDQRVGRANQNFTRPASPQFDWLLERVQSFLGTSHCWFIPLLCGNEPVGGILWIAKEGGAGATGNSMAGMTDLQLVSQSWGMTLRTAQIREQQTLLTESLAAANRELGTLQQQLVRAKSLAGLGEMAAGAAHEMNNPLMVISGRAQLLTGKISETGMKAEANLIYQQADRLSQIITDMMEFAKPQPPKAEPLDFGQIVQDAIDAAGKRAEDGHSSKVAVRTEMAPNLPPGHGDSRQIKNALTEVMLNAIQATRAAEANDAAQQPAAKGGSRDIVVQLRFDALDSQVIVQITDQGIGMSEDVMRQAFSPFYSAKTAGRNRGLGLAKALRWVENHSGTIRLDSALGSGTTAVVILPLAGVAVLEEKPARKLQAIAAL